jgi:hypothetical protein
MKQSRRDKCQDNIIDIANGELKFFRAKGVTKKEYNVWCGGKNSKIRVKCDEVRPNSHPKKWVFTKGKNPETACPNSGRYSIPVLYINLSKVQQVVVHQEDQQGAAHQEARQEVLEVTELTTAWTRHS